MGETGLPYDGMERIQVKKIQYKEGLFYFISLD